MQSVREREDGRVAIGDRTVAELVREHRFRPLTMVYLDPRGDGEFCGCGVGLIALAINGPASVSMSSGSCFATCADETDLGIGGVHSFEAGWCWPLSAPEPEGPRDREALRLGDLAYRQAVEAYLEIDPDFIPAGRA